MDPNVIDFLENILADVVGTSIVSAPAIVWFLRYRSRRKKLIKFFELDQKSPELRIFQSRIEVRKLPGGEPATKAAPDQTVTEGFTGPAITMDEVSVIKTLEDELFPTFILDKYLLKPIRVSSTPAPAEVAPAEATPAKDKKLDDHIKKSTIVVGSPVYNSITGYCQKNFNLPFKFDKRDGLDGKEYRAFIRNGKEIQGNQKREKEIGVIHRIINPETRHLIIICAGLSSTATKGSVLYLVANWEVFYKKYKSGEFTIYLDFGNVGHENVDMWLKDGQVYYKDKIGNTTSPKEIL